MLRQMAGKNSRLKIIATESWPKSIWNGSRRRYSGAGQRYRIEASASTCIRNCKTRWRLVRASRLSGFLARTPTGLIDRANAFLYRLEASGDLARLKDRYFGHVNRLTQLDSTRFIERLRELLPKYRPMFQNAQIATGIDWRLLAIPVPGISVNPLATSPTGVRGMMMPIRGYGR